MAMLIEGGGEVKGPTGATGATGATGTGATATGATGTGPTGQAGYWRKMDDGTMVFIPIGGASTNITVQTDSKTTDPTLIGITEAMVAAHPELGAVRALYLKGDYAGAYDALMRTDFYRSVSASAFNNEITRVNKPGVYQQIINQEWMPALKAYSVRQGYKISDGALQQIAQTAYRMGLDVTSPATLELFKGADATGKSYIEGIVGGVAQQTKDRLNALVSDYGVKMDPNFVEQKALDIAKGISTEAQWADSIKQTAKSTYAAWAPQIDAGMTIKDIANPYLQTYASLLEMPSSQVKLDDPLIQRALQGDTAGDKTPAAMPLWQFERQIKADNRYMYTSRARAEIDNVAHGVLKDMGLAY